MTGQRPVYRALVTLALCLFALAPASADDTKERLRERALVLMGRAEVLLSEPALPLEGRRAVEAAQAWLEDAEEQRKRRNFATAVDAQDKARLELELADAHLRVATVAVLKRELEAVVQELSEQIDAEDGS